MNIIRNIYNVKYLIKGAIFWGLEISLWTTHQLCEALSSSLKAISWI